MYKYINIIHTLLYLCAISIAVAVACKNTEKIIEVHHTDTLTRIDTALIDNPELKYQIQTMYDYMDEQRANIIEAEKELTECLKSKGSIVYIRKMKGSELNTYLLEENAQLKVDKSSLQQELRNIKIKEANKDKSKDKSKEVEKTKTDNSVKKGNFWYAFWAGFLSCAALVILIYSLYIYFRRKV